MSKKKIAIRFKTIHQLWEYAQQIKATNMEIITNDMILLCDCSEEDLKGLSHYGGEIIQGYHPSSNQQPTFTNG